MMSKGGICEVPRYQKIMEIRFGGAHILRCGNLVGDLWGMSVGLISCIDIALLMSLVLKRIVLNWGGMCWEFEGEHVSKIDYRLCRMWVCHHQKGGNWCCSRFWCVTNSHSIWWSVQVCRLMMKQEEVHRVIRMSLRACKVWRRRSEKEPLISGLAELLGFDKETWRERWEDREEREEILWRKGNKDIDIIFISLKIWLSYL